MAAKLDPDQQLAHAETALQLLLEAREHLKDSDNKQTLARVRAAISSAKGAVRICRYRVARASVETAPCSGMFTRLRPAAARASLRK